jgi:hypothetical protein
MNVLGYYAIGDGGGGPFYYNSASMAVDDGGTVIRPTSVAESDPGRWLRNYSGPLSIRCFGAKGDGDSAAAVVNTAAFHTAIALFASGGTIFVPCGNYRITGGLTWGSSIASLIGEGRYSIIECIDQTGAIIDLSISSLVSDFQFSQQIAHLYLLGDQTADPTKTHCGIRLHGSVTCVSFHHLIIVGTGGPCLKLETEADCCSFENISLFKPVGANANNVPWLHLYGVANGNIFKNVILRETTLAELSGVEGCIRIEENPDALGPGQAYSPNHNKFIACQSEFIHIPENGSVVHCDGRNNDFDHFVDYDSDTLTPTTNTCIIRFPANATYPYGGNIVRGSIPGSAGGSSFPTCGVIVASNGNNITGLSAYVYVVKLAAGAARNYVCIGGTSQSSTEFLITDDSGAANAIVNAAERGDFAVSNTLAVRSTPGTVISPNYAILAFDAALAGTPDYRCAEISSVDRLLNIFEGRLIFKVTDAAGVLNEVMNIDGVTGVTVAGNIEATGVVTEYLRTTQLGVGADPLPALPTVPALVSGVDSPTSAVVASLVGSTDGAFLSFSDTVGNWGIGMIPASGGFGFYSGRAPGNAGNIFLRLTITDNLLIGNIPDIAGASGLGVAGNIESVTAGNGLILQSPNGLVRKLVTIDNAGAIVLTTFP